MLSAIRREDWVILYTIYHSLRRHYVILYTIYHSMRRFYVICYTIYRSLRRLYVILYTIYHSSRKLYVILYTIYHSFKILCVILYTIYHSLRRLYVIIYTIYHSLRRLRYPLCYLPFVEKMIPGKRIDKVNLAFFTQILLLARTSNLRIRSVYSVVFNNRYIISISSVINLACDTLVQHIVHDLRKRGTCLRCRGP